MANDTQDRDQQILNRLANIEHKVDSLEQTTAFALRADTEAHLNSVREVFGKGVRRAQVYLAADGQRTVEQIKDHLHISQTAVSRALGELKDEGLVDIVATRGSSNIWGKKPIDRTVRISPFLMKEFNLDSSGRPL